MTTEQNAFPFTQSRLEAIKPPKASRDTYRDSKTAGLTFVITVNGSKSFYYYKRIEGKPTRIRIGGFPEISIDDARREAQKFSGEIAKGENPQTVRRKKTNAVRETYAKCNGRTLIWNVVYGMSPVNN